MLFVVVGVLKYVSDVGGLFFDVGVICYCSLAELSFACACFSVFCVLFAFATSYCFGIVCTALCFSKTCFTTGDCCVAMC